MWLRLDDVQGMAAGAPLDEWASAIPGRLSLGRVFTSPVVDAVASLNGYRPVTFNINANMYQSNLDYSAASRSVTIVYLARITEGSTSGSGRVLQGVRNDVAVGWGSGRRDACMLQNWLSQGTTPVTTGWTLTTLTMAAYGNVRFYVNGSLIGSGSNAAGQSFVGPRGLAFNFNNNLATYETSAFQLAEMVVYSRALPDDERQSVEGYMVSLMAHSVSDRTMSGRPSSPIL